MSIRAAIERGRLTGLVDVIAGDRGVWPALGSPVVEAERTSGRSLTGSARRRLTRSRHAVFAASYG